MTDCDKTTGDRRSNSWHVLMKGIQMILLSIFGLNIHKIQIKVLTLKEKNIRYIFNSNVAQKGRSEHNTSVAILNSLGKFNKHTIFVFSSGALLFLTHIFLSVYRPTYVSVCCPHKMNSIRTFSFLKKEKVKTCSRRNVTFRFRCFSHRLHLAVGKWRYSYLNFAFLF